MKTKYILAMLSFVAFSNLNAQEPVSGDTLRFTYERFIKQPGIEKTEGLKNAQGLSINAYRLKDNYYVEIPQDAFNKDILITAYSPKGYNGYVSDASCIIKFHKGNDIHSLFMTRNRSLDVQNDSTDVSMMEALRMSNLQPIDMSFNVVSEGENHDSYIIDVSQDINSPRGLFDVSKNSQMNNPDPKRSHVDGIDGIDGGVIFKLVRSQTDIINRTMTTTTEVSSTNVLHFLMQLLPQREISLKQANPFYGFETMSRQEYDTKTYVSRRMSYIKQWNLKNNKHIIVYMSPTIPKPYAEATTKAFAQWEKAFAAAGIANPFIYTTDEKEAYVGYNHIYVDCNGTDVRSSKISDDLTGEIVAARLNINDYYGENMKFRYYNYCRKIDKRASKDLLDINVRKDVLESRIAREIGFILGLKKNTSGDNAFSIEQLRSNKWLDKYGCSASITDNFVFNYVAQPEDGIKVSNLFPKVSIYDNEAIAYAYGKRKKAPSMPSAYYVPEDTKIFIFKDPLHLSNDWLAASKLGINNIRKGYETLHRDMTKLPSEQNSYQMEHSLILNALAEYQQMIENIAEIVGYVKVLPVIKGVNSVKYNYTSKQSQIDALNFLSNELLHGVPEWIDREDCRKVCEGNISDMTRAIAVSVYKKLLKIDVIGHLVEAEDRLGSNAYTATELFSFIDKELFCNFDENTPVAEYERLLQANIVPAFADEAFNADLSLGMDNDGTVTMNSYFIHISEKIKYLAEKHKDEATRENYKMIMMRLNRQYFDKEHR